MAKDILRRVKFTPYRADPTFSLVLWYTGRTDRMNKDILGYRLTQHERSRKAKVLFEGEDFASSPMHAIDSDETVAALMSFLTLRPGDTDPEYFERYTPQQLEFAQQHGEALGIEAMTRFGEL